MRTLATVLLIGVFAAPLGAQGRGRNSVGAQGIPPGQLPPAGTCRVWYEGRPPGQQPSPTNCDQAERVASRDSRARVIYGAQNGRQQDGWWNGDDRNGRTTNGRTGNGRTVAGYQSVAYDNGYRDGLQKGREDARENHDYDPVRHSWYRNGTRGYNNDDGSKVQYRNVYRDGFESGYAAGYRNNADARDRQRNGGIVPRAGGVNAPAGGVVRRWP
jgi:hypothetical protein